MLALGGRGIVEPLSGCRRSRRARFAAQADGQVRLLAPAAGAPHRSIRRSSGHVARSCNLTRRRCEELAQAPYRAEQVHANRRFTDAERGADLAVLCSAHVAERKHRALPVRQLFNRRSNPPRARST